MNKMFQISCLGLAVASTAMLSGCGSSGGSSNSTNYVQFYNASPNSSRIALELDDYNYSHVSFADANSRSAIASGDYDLSFTGVDEGGDESKLLEDRVDIKKGKRNLIVAAGDYADVQMFHYRFNDDSDDLDPDEMQLHIANLNVNLGDVDIYLGLEGAVFADAEFIGTLSFGDFTDAMFKETDDYVLYVTEPGTTDTIFQTQGISLNSEIPYVLAVRDSFGPGALPLAIDRITSSTTVSAYEDINGTAQFRVYNGVRDVASLTAEAQSPDETVMITDIAAGSVSDYEEVAFNDYGFSAFDGAERLTSNLLVSLSQNQSKTVAFYRNADGEVAGLSFEESQRRLAYESDINVVNLSFSSDLDVYFVPPGETVEDTDFVFFSLDSEEFASFSLPTDTYRINIISENPENDVKTVLCSAESTDITGNNSYSIIIEQAQDDEIGCTLTTLN